MRNTHVDEVHVVQNRPSRGLGRVPQLVVVGFRGVRIDGAEVWRGASRAILRSQERDCKMLARSPDYFR